MPDFNQLIFKDKSFSDILEEIYTSKQKRSQKTEEIINHLQSLVTNLTEATIVIPVLNQCLETEIKNDELLVKAVAVIQRHITKEKTLGEADGMGGISFSEQEMKELDNLRTKMIETNSPKQIEEQCNTLIEELSSSLSITPLTQLKPETDFDIADSTNTFDELRRSIEQIMESQNDSTDN